MTEKTSDVPDCGDAPWADPRRNLPGHVPPHSHGADDRPIATRAADWSDKHLIWTLTTAIPVLGAGPWVYAALRVNRAKYLANALAYFAWPAVGVFLNFVVVAVVPALVMTQHTAARGPYYLLHLLLLWVCMWAASLVNAQREWKTLLHEEPARPGDKSYALAFLLWLMLGWLGAHRFYTGRWVTGLLYAASFGLFGLGWGFDLLLLIGMVARANRERLARPAPPLDAIPAPSWAADRGPLDVLDFLLRIAFFLAAPFVFVILCVLMNRMELIVLVVAVLVACGLLGNLSRWLERLEAAGKMPLVDDALERVRFFHDFYFEHRPRSFFYYLFFPVTAPVACLISADARREAWMYARLIGMVVAVIVIEQVYSYFSTYPPHLGPGDALQIAFVMNLFTVFTVVVFMIPTITTSFALNLSGQQGKLKGLMILALIVALPAGVLRYYKQFDGVSLASQQLLKMRLKKPSFRQELGESTGMFLTYHAQRMPADGASAFAAHPDLTAKYRRHIAGLTPNDEVNAFTVFTLSLPGESQPWLGVRLWFGLTDPPQLLFVASPNAQLYTQWNDLPPAVQEQFQVIEEYEPENQKRFDLIAKAALIDDA